MGGKPGETTKAEPPGPPKGAPRKAVKAGRFPHVPTWEKVGAAGFFGLSIVFGVGFMNAGDGTETRTEQVCPEGSGPGRSLGVGPRCEKLRGFDEPPPARAEGLAEQVGDVSISVPGGQSAPGTITPGGGGTLSFVVPLFAIGEPHRVELRNAEGMVLDGFSFTVPASSGAAPPIATEQGGTIACDVDHQNPVPPGRSGAGCLYTQPAAPTAPGPQPQPDGDGATVEPVTRTVEEATEGKPWSLLAIPGAALGALGALALEEERRRREGGWDAGSQTYPDWNETYPDWAPAEQPESRPAEDVPTPGDESPEPSPDVM